MRAWGPPVIVELALILLRSASAQPNSVDDEAGLLGFMHPCTASAAVIWFHLMPSVQRRASAAVDFGPYNSSAKREDLDEERIHFLLRYLRYRSPWATFKRISDHSPSRRRIIDFLAMQTFASRGIELHGGEIKTARGDWLGELKNASKADGWALSCHRFYIIAPKGVVLPQEVPEPWGHLEITNYIVKERGKPVDRQSIEETKPAPWREAAPSWELTATLMRAALKVGENIITPLEIHREMERREAILRTHLRIEQSEAQHNVTAPVDPLHGEKARLSAALSHLDGFEADLLAAKRGMQDKLKKIRNSILSDAVRND